MWRRTETACGLARLPLAPTAQTIRSWRAGETGVRSAKNRAFLASLERRWALPDGYLAPPRAAEGAVHADFRRSLATLPEDLKTLRGQLLRWHLPPDYGSRPTAEQKAIADWLRRTFVEPERVHRAYLSAGVRQGATLRLTPSPRGRATTSQETADRSRAASPRLSAEWAAFAAYKTAPILALGRYRDTTWTPGTARGVADLLGRLFGCLTREADAHPGLGQAVEDVSLGHLVFPAVWDAYIRARARSRGYFARSELNLLAIARSLCRAETGWFVQMPQLRDGLAPLPGLVERSEIVRAQADWSAACGTCRAYAETRSRDLRRIARRHREAHAPVAVVLAHPRPLALYRTVGDEILKQGHDGESDPLRAARALQLYLMFRLALHTGFRQRTLRELGLLARGTPETDVARLQCLGRGELAWRARSSIWRIVAPPSAFKNEHSSVFRHGAYELDLPDVDGLYARLDRFADHDRAILLAGRQDLGGLFVRTRLSAPPQHTDQTFYHAWRGLIERYGIANPWTGLGAVDGLRPHGPHSVRAILATHILKQTGSFTLAGYALQDCARTVEDCYAGLAPPRRSEQVADLLKDVWVGSG